MKIPGKYEITDVEYVNAVLALTEGAMTYVQAMQVEGKPAEDVDLHRGSAVSLALVLRSALIGRLLVRGVLTAQLVTGDKEHLLGKFRNALENFPKDMPLPARQMQIRHVFLRLLSDYGVQ